MVKYTLKVAEIRQETVDTVTVCFKQPGLKKIRYKPGQYLTVIFRINGRQYIRPYSFSSAPGIDQYLEITVKRVPGGIVSNHICDKVAVGDIIEVVEPMGDFTLREELIDDQIHIVLWAAGSGITPIFSLLKHILRNTQIKVTLVYGNRNFDSVIFLKEIKELQNAYVGRVTIWHFHTQLIVEEEHPNIIQGRIKPERVLSVMHDEGDIDSSFHYICGPVGLKESVKMVLADLNVPPENIFSEEFELLKNEKDLEHVITRSVTIVVGSVRHEVEVVRGKTILEAGLDSMLELSYSCQTGSCSLCKGNLIAGGLRRAEVVKGRGELEANEYLLCCAYPLTDNVVVQV